MCSIYSGKITETIKEQCSCMKINYCLFEDLPCSIESDSIGEINIVRSQFFDNYQNVSIIIKESNYIKIQYSCFVRCSLKPPYGNEDGCVVRLKNSAETNLSGLSLFGCTASMNSWTDRYVVFFSGKSGSLLDSNCTFNRMWIGSGPNLAAEKSNFMRCQIIGSFTLETISFVKGNKEEPEFKYLIFANNICNTEIFINSNEDVGIVITDSFFLNNNVSKVFQSYHIQIIVKNSIFSCNMFSSNLVTINDNNTFNYNGDYSYPIVGRHIGCLGLGFQTASKNLKNLMLGICTVCCILNKKL